jgi:hypothetical protein
MTQIMSSRVTQMQAILGSVSSRFGIADTCPFRLLELFQFKNEGSKVRRETLCFFESFSNLHGKG